MKIYEANVVTDTEIELKSSNDLEAVYDCIDEESNFILQWNEDGQKRSKVMIGNNLTPKIRNGDIILTAKEEKKK